MRQDLLSALGVEAINSKQIEVDGRTYTVRVPTIGEILVLGNSEHEGAVQMFALKLVAEMPADLTWENIQALPSNASSVIANIVKEVLKVASPAQDENLGN